ncbi:MAG: IS21-like element helper ATPase IstB [Anaerolineae bacterium]|nr:IS21-like element helper ATPase IstB [Anaerolineae bacterium]MCZ2099364.1 IS21-like element helper ATPase IstB [Anaerolineae bacterium]MCZ2099666.1 IS21-like element helper ATPase IstB [Anaerolineae bacterium]
MNLADIDRALRQLRLSGIAATLPTRVLQAQASQQPFLETLGQILQDELDRRRTRLNERRFKLSCLDERLTFAEFDWSFNPKVPRAACFELHTLKFIADGGNALIIGKPGTGKSHVAKAIAYEATLQGYRVRYAEADAELTRYAVAAADERNETMREFVDTDLLVLDDLFLARRLPEAGAELLQAVVHARYKRRAAIVVTSNRMLEDWGKYLGDNTMVTTILDRLMHHAAMLRFEGKSYRMRALAARISASPAEA